MSISHGQSENFEHQWVSGLLPKAKPPGPFSYPQAEVLSQRVLIKGSSDQEHMKSASARFNISHTVPLMYGYSYFTTEKCKDHEVLSTTANDAHTFRQSRLSEYIKCWSGPAG